MGLKGVTISWLWGLCIYHKLPGAFGHASALLRLLRREVSRTLSSGRVRRGACRSTEQMPTLNKQLLVAKYQYNDDSEFPYRNTGEVWTRDSVHSSPFTLWVLVHACRGQNRNAAC